MSDKTRAPKWLQERAQELRDRCKEQSPAASLRQLTVEWRIEHTKASDEMDAARWHRLWRTVEIMVDDHTPRHVEHIALRFADDLENTADTIRRLLELQAAA